jgi:hypothetical protein
LLKERLKPLALPLDRQLVARLIAELNDDDFKVRDDAQESLQKLASRVELPVLQREQMRVVSSPSL